ncbi:MAG: NAD(P)-binding domain-containing protein [Bacteroidota bacterium]|nr:NAD(P)-binding domain-containing protein [Bacteroidota bacterium]
MKKIGIIGSGVVGKTLGTGFVKQGYQVMLGTRDATKLNEWKITAGSDGAVGTLQETCKFADTLVLAVKGTAAKNVLEMIGRDNLRGKTIIDCTNPISDISPVNGVINFFTTYNRSLMEEMQTMYPEVNFVKAFNSVGNTMMIHPNFNGQTPTMFICGNNQSAKRQVTEICRELGWESEDMGLVESARAIECLSMLWMIPALRENNWNHAFKLLKK